jgi:hypothetical protein
MRPLVKYGVPAAAGLGAGGYALSQEEDPGSAILAGATGALGGAAGLLGARGLAGKYSPVIVQELDKRLTGLGNRIGDYGRTLPKESRVRSAATGAAADLVSALQGAATGPNAIMPWPSQANKAALAKGLTAAMVPGSAAAAGLGGVALGAIPGAMGVPGFQQGVVDPEAYGSSNSEGARYKAPTMQYM